MACSFTAIFTAEVRHGIGHAAHGQMTGAELLKLNVPVTDEPGSALVFYRRE